MDTTGRAWTHRFVDTAGRGHSGMLQHTHTHTHTHARTQERARATIYLSVSELIEAVCSGSGSPSAIPTEEEWSRSTRRKTFKIDTMRYLGSRRRLPPPRCVCFLLAAYSPFLVIVQWISVDVKSFILEGTTGGGRGGEGAINHSSSSSTWGFTSTETIRLISDGRAPVTSSDTQSREVSGKPQALHNGYRWLYKRCKPQALQNAYIVICNRWLSARQSVSSVRNECQVPVE